MKKYANLLPLGRLGWPEDIAGPATFLASPDADYITGVLLFVGTEVNWPERRLPGLWLDFSGAVAGPAMR